MKTIHYGLALALLLGTGARQAAAQTDSLYRVGRDALSDNDYRRAANIFKQLADRYPSAKNAGDALYWRAWSLNKLGTDRRSQRDLDDALAAVDRLERQYPMSTTIADARALRSNIRSAQAALGNAAAAGDIAREAKSLTQQGPCKAGSRAEEEIRMAALDGLLNMNSADAVPILKDVLRQTDPCRVELRKKAVFVLSQKDGPDVARTLLDVARTDPSTEMRKEAIQWLSQTRSDVAVPALDSILRQATDNEIRKAAIFSLSQKAQDARARAALQRAAEDERMPEEIREEAVFWLGQAGTVDLEYFRTLFQKTKGVEMRKKILFSVSQHPGNGATAWLIDIAKDKAYDIEVRKEAIFAVSQRATVDMTAINGVYDSAKGDDEMQKQVIFVYSQRREAAAVDKLMDIAKNDSRLENRKEAIFWLGQKEDPRIKQFLRDLIIKD